VVLVKKALGLDITSVRIHFVAIVAAATLLTVYFFVIFVIHQILVVDHASNPEIGRLALSNGPVLHGSCLCPVIGNKLGKLIAVFQALPTHAI
jgi:phage shock protein PspC (stress-responsive transcriptional regulator)